MGKRSLLQWVKNYLDFCLEIEIPPQALPAVKMV